MRHPRFYKGEEKLSFGALLACFLFFFLIGPLMPSSFGPITLQISFTAILVASIFTINHHRRMMLIAAFLAFFASVLNGYNYYEDTFLSQVWALSLSLLLVILITSQLFKDVFFTRSIEINLIFGSICVYVMLAILWALLYSLIELLQPGSFRNIAAEASSESKIFHPMLINLQAFLYFSFVTQTTLGFGDITPITAMAKNYVAVQATTGIFYLAILVGGLTNRYIAERKFEHKTR